MKLAKLYFIAIAFGITMFGFTSAVEAKDKDPVNYIWQLRAGLHNSNNVFEKKSEDLLIRVGETACSYKAQGYDMDRFANELFIKLSSTTSNSDSAEEKMVKGEFNTHILDFLRLSYWSANDWLCRDNSRP